MSMQGQDRRRFALVRQVAARVFGRAASRPEPEPEPEQHRRLSPAPDPPGRAEDDAPDLWKEPVPVMEDHEGHLHLLL